LSRTWNELKGFLSGLLYPRSGSALGNLFVAAVLCAVMCVPRTCLGVAPEEAVRRAVAAQGGAEAIHKTEKMGMRNGTFTQFFPAPNSGSFVEWRKGEKVRIDVQIAGLEVVQGFDGERAWVQSFGQVIDAPDQIQTSIEEEARHSFMLLVDAQEGRVQVQEARPSTLLGGGQVEGVAIIPADDSPATDFYFDPESSYVVKMAYTDVNPFKGGETNFEVYFLDYRSAEGIPYPAKVIHYIGGVKLDEVSYESVDFDADKPDAYFMKPGADRRVALGGKQTTVQLEYAMDLLFVEARINGADAPSNFLLDTGAGLTCLSAETADAFGIKASAGMSAAGAGGALSARAARLDSLTLGDLTVDDLEVMVVDIAYMGEMMDRQIDGILGYNLLNRFTTTIDITGGTLTFTDSDASLPDGEGSHSLPFQVLMGVPVIQGTVDSTAKLDFLVDTGAAVSILPKAVAEKLKPESTLEGALASGADARPIEMVTARFTELALDGARVDQPVFSSPVSPAREDPVGLAVDTANRGVLGTGILRNFRVTLNYDKATLVLEPIEGVPGDEFEWCGPGLSIFKEDGIATVKAVYAGSPADGVIDPGDKIIEIDGKQLEGVPLPQVVGLLRGKPGTSVRLLIERDGEKKAVTLKRQELL
jgi:predicted aspartyl protease